MANLKINNKMKINNKIISLQNSIIFGEEIEMTDGRKSIKIGDEIFIINEEIKKIYDGVLHLHRLQLTRIISIEE